MQQKCIAEFLGTLILVFCGTAAIIVNDITGGTVTHVGIAMVFGLVVSAMIYTFGEISGAHINPAVTIAFWVAKRFPGKQVLPYLVSQFSGAIFASGLLFYLFKGHANYGATLPAFGDNQAFVLELILTFILMLTIISVATGSKEQGIMAGVAIGGIVALEALFAGPITGASMNPARSLAPALISGQLSSLWLYLCAPVIGACLATLCCRCFKKTDCCR